MHMVWTPFSFEKHSFGLFLSPKQKISNKNNFLYVYLTITKVEQYTANGNISKKDDKNVQEQK